MNRILMASIASLVTFGASTAFGDISYQRSPSLIHLTGSDYWAYKRSGVVQPVFIGSELDERGNTINLCAYQSGGSGSGYGDNGREVYVLARVDRCPAPRTPRVVSCEQAVLGHWGWGWGTPVVMHGDVEFHNDGHVFYNGSKEGSWSCYGYAVTLTWETSVDHMTLTADLRAMRGVTNGVPVEGRR
jgi:hypothetical protein